MPHPTPTPISALLPFRVPCHPAISTLKSEYGYFPSFAAGVLYCVLFGLAFSIQFFRSIRYHRWTSHCLFFGALIELLGWSGRTWSAKCPYNGTAFLIQISTLVIAPIFFAAAIYLVLGRLIWRRGTQYSLLKPKKYLWTFCTCDVLSLCVQAVGGGIASAEANKGESAAPGTHFLVAGIGLQLVSMTIFSVCFIIFLVRSRRVMMPKNERLVIYSMTLSLVCVYIRSAYRVVELSQGWKGYLITHERYFIALDAAMMVIAVWSLIVLDPALLLKGGDKDATSGAEAEADTQGSATEVEEQRVEIEREK